MNSEYIWRKNDEESYYNDNNDKNDNNNIKNSVYLEEKVYCKKNI